MPIPERLNPTFARGGESSAHVDPVEEAKQRLIVALDVPTVTEALRIVAQLDNVSFFKIGSVAFGNGITIMPLVQADVVDAYHWLSPAQFTDGIALGQIFAASARQRAVSRAIRPAYEEPCVPAKE